MIQALQDFHFLRPWWLLGAVPAILLALRWARRQAAGSHWQEAVEPSLLAVLLEPAGAARQRGGAWAVAIALLAGAIGLAGPAWERLPQPVERKADALIVLFDLSLSMLAEDLKPSRLARAKHKIADALRRRDEGLTALIAYAGDAHAVAPLTDDTRTIENLLAALNPTMMPVLGSNPASALELARELFANAHVDQGRILLVTDGIDRIAELADFSDRRFPISVLGVGTPQGGAIPLDAAGRPGEFLRTEQRALIRAALEEERLAALAELCRGRYRTAGLSDADIEDLLATALPGSDETRALEREFDVWADAGHWAALVLLPFVLLGFRRGLLACLALCLLAPPAFAGLWNDLWQRRDRQAWQALQEGKPKAAAELFEDARWRSAADYRSENYRQAAEGWAERSAGASAIPDDHYNLGNALAQLGDYANALAAFDRTLALAPEHEDAAFNKALLEQLMEERQQSQSQQQGQKGGEPQEGGESQDSSAQEKRSEPQAGTEPQSDGEPQGGNQDAAQGQPQSEREPAAQPPPEQSPEAPQQQGQEAPGEAAQDALPEQAAPGEEAPPPRPALGEETALRDEQLDALEQWLRRVPDDPGGLLQRKFQHETNERLRRGDYRHRQREKIW